MSDLIVNNEVRDSVILCKAKSDSIVVVSLTKNILP